MWLHARSSSKERKHFEGNYRNFKEANREKSFTLTVNDNEAHEDINREYNEEGVLESTTITRSESNRELNSWLFSRYLSSWSTCLTGLSVGSIVFAPYRSSCMCKPESDLSYTVCDDKRKHGKVELHGSSGNSSGSSSNRNITNNVKKENNKNKSKQTSDLPLFTSSSLSSLPTHSCVPLLTSDEDVTLHYALAEITGVQSDSGSVCVSYLFTLAGVDDETMSVFDLIPCPLSTLARMQPATQSHWCSLLERVLHVPTAASSLSSSLACRLLHDQSRQHHSTNTDINKYYCDEYNCHDDEKGNPYLLGFNDVVCLGECESGTQHSLTHRDNQENNNNNNNNKDGNKKEHNIELMNGRQLKEESAECEGPFPTRKKVKVEWAESARPEENANTSHSCEYKSKRTELMQVNQNSEDAITFQWRHACSECDVLTFEYKTEYNVHTFLAFTFQRTVQWLDSKFSDSSSLCVHNQLPIMEQQQKYTNVLCIFDSYEALRHFEVYMCARGHIIILLDGTQNTKLSEESCSTLAELLLPAHERELKYWKEEENESKSSKENKRICKECTQTHGKVKSNRVNQSIPTFSTLPYVRSYKESSKTLRWLCALREDAELVIGIDDNSSDIRKEKCQGNEYRTLQYLGIRHLLEHVSTLHYTVFFHEKDKAIEKEKHLSKHAQKTERVSEPSPLSLALHERPCNNCHQFHSCSLAHASEILQNEIKCMYPVFFQASNEVRETNVLISKERLYGESDDNLTTNDDADRFFHVYLHNLPWQGRIFEPTKNRYEQKKEELLEEEKLSLEKLLKARGKVETSSLCSNAVKADELKRECNALKHRRRGTTITTSTTSPHSSSKLQATEASSRVKVSAEVFENNKILVPASREQLMLLHTILRETNSMQTCNDNVANKKNNTERTNTLHSYDAVYNVNSLLLECIALGNFTNAALQTLFHDYKNVICAVTAPTECKKSKEKEWYQEQEKETESYLYSSKEHQNERCRKQEAMRNALNNIKSDCKIADKTSQVSTTNKSQYPFSSCNREQMLECANCESARYFSSFKALHHILFSEPSQIDRIFPVFAAVKAIINDVFATPSYFTASCQWTRSDCNARKSKMKILRPLLPKVIILMPYSGDRDQSYEFMSNNNLHQSMSRNNDEERNALRHCDIDGEKNSNGSCRENTHEQDNKSNVLSCPTCDRRPSVMSVDYNADKKRVEEVEKYNLLTALREFFSPWYLYHITWKEGYEMKEASKCNTSLEKWRTSGGVALVGIDDSVAQLGQIHLEADVIIAVGKRAAAWAAAHNTLKMSQNFEWCEDDSCKENCNMKCNRHAGSDDDHITNIEGEKMPTYFAVMSEIEIVHDIIGHHWTWFDIRALEVEKSVRSGRKRCENNGDSALWHTLLKQTKINNNVIKSQQNLPNKIVDEALRYYLHMLQKHKEQKTLNSSEEVVTKCCFSHRKELIKQMALQTLKQKSLRLNELQFYEVE